MRFKILLFVFALVITGALPIEAQSYVPIAANGSIHTDLWLYNPSSAPVTQKVGHQRFIHQGLNDIIVEPTVTIAAGATTWLRRVDLNFDSDYRQVPGCYDTPQKPCGFDMLTSMPGFYVWPIDSRLEAKVVVEYPGVTVFEVDAITKGIAATTDALVYRMVGTDFQSVKNGVEYPGRGAFPTFLNLGGPTSVVLTVCDATGCVDERSTVGAGIRQVGIQRVCADGCSVIMQFCHGACGGGDPRNPALLMFIAQGPPDGKQQSIRYGK